MKRLTRSRNDAKLGGVCAGLADYLELDPTLVRVIFVVFALFTGVGLVAYFLLWIVIPYEDRAGADASETAREGAEEIAARAREIGESIREGKGRTQAGLVAGLVLIALGGLILLRNLGFWFHWLDFGTLWPLLLVALGVALLWRRTKGD
ncbi:MAG: PspC domain-containing protein [Patescibacteria group bacterium]